MLYDLDHVTLSQSIFIPKECCPFKVTPEKVGVIPLGTAHLPCSGATADPLEATLEAEKLSSGWL